MSVSAKKPFKTLAVRYNTGYVGSAIFSIDDDLGEFVDSFDDTLEWHEFWVYGVSDIDEDIDKIYEDDFSSATQIGIISGCHIPNSLILNLGEDPYQICDSNHGDLEAMYSVLREYEDDFIGYNDDIYYIEEIELDFTYQGFGYEKILLLQLPAIIVKALRVFPSLLMYYPKPAKYRKPKRDLKAEAILMHRIEYAMQKSIKSKENEKILLFPPIVDVPEKEVNRVLGLRNPGDTVPEAYRNQGLYKLYESAGFKEIGKTGWLCKPIASIYYKDGLNH